jgi:hypothetical protein
MLSQGRLQRAGHLLSTYDDVADGKVEESHLETLEVDRRMLLRRTS